MKINNPVMTTINSWTFTDKSVIKKDTKTNKNVAIPTYKDICQWLNPRLRKR